MTEHVCPVGALTSSDFRFKARVWFLRSARTRLPGLRDGLQRATSTTIRATTRVYRHRPRENVAVNKYWMCDEGMLSYQRAIEGRLLSARSSAARTRRIDDALAAAKDAAQGPRERPVEGRDRALARSTRTRTTSRWSTLAKTYLGAGDFFVSGRPLGRGDDILMSEDKNPNTRGVMQIASTTPPRPIAELLDAIDAGTLPRT